AVQLSDAGNYDVVVSSPYGTTNSAVAVLTVQSCQTAPSGLVAWWRAEGNALDSAGTNDGSLIGGIGFAPGEVGLGFAPNGTNTFIAVSTSPVLNLPQFSVETWAFIDPLTLSVFGGFGSAFVAQGNGTSDAGGYWFGYIASQAGNTNIAS